MRLIDADALKTSFDMPKEYDEFAFHVSLPIIKATIDDAPTIDPVKHGHWINKGFEPIRCSVCGIKVDALNGIPWACKSFKYCPYCGAKMDEVTDG